MTRRELLQDFGIALAAAEFLPAAPAGPVQALQSTEPLTWEGDLAERLMDGAHQFVTRKISDSIRAGRSIGIATFPRGRRTRSRSSQIAVDSRT